MWRSLVSRLVRVQETSGSNPDTPTRKVAVFCSVKVAKTAVFFCNRLELAQINHPPVWVRYTVKSGFDPDLTQTGVIMRTVEKMGDFKSSENAVFQILSRCCFGTGIGCVRGYLFLRIVSCCLTVV